MRILNWADKIGFEVKPADKDLYTLVPDQICAENVIDWVNQKISTPALSWGEAFQPVRFVGAGAFAVTASLEGVLLGLSVIIALAPASVKWALQSLRFQAAVDLSQGISDAYTFQNLWLNSTVALGLGGCAIVATTAMCIKPQWGIDLFHKWVKPIKLPSNSSRILKFIKDVSLISLSKMRLAQRTSKASQNLYRYCRKHPAVPLSIASILISSACLALWIFEDQSKLDEQINDDLVAENDNAEPLSGPAKIWTWVSARLPQTQDQEVGVVSALAVCALVGVLFYTPEGMLLSLRGRIDKMLPRPLLFTIQTIRNWSHTRR
ncbi:MAG: hypothetical protein Q8K75_07665 [Chlamydiales bacterium]|nr:hypothetical protein [Chlamydiales bacterium]